MENYTTTWPILPLPYRYHHQYSSVDMDSTNATKSSRDYHCHQLAYYHPTATSHVISHHRALHVCTFRLMLQHSPYNKSSKSVKTLWNMRTRWIHSCHGNTGKTGANTVDPISKQWRVLRTNREINVYPNAKRWKIYWSALILWRNIITNCICEELEWAMPLRM